MTGEGIFIHQNEPDAPSHKQNNNVKRRSLSSISDDNNLMMVILPKVDIDQ